MNSYNSAEELFKDMEKEAQGRELRDVFALEAFKIIVTDYIENGAGKLSMKEYLALAYPYADVALSRRDKKTNL